MFGLLRLQFKEGWGALTKTSPKKELRYFREISRFEADESKPEDRRYIQVLRHFDILNGKSSSLLTHLSIMIAVTSFMIFFLYPDGIGDVFGVLLILELLLYIFLTLPAISALYITSYWTIETERNQSSGNNAVQKALIKAFVLRRQNFYVAYFGCIISTALFSLTIVAKLLFDVAESLF